MPDQRRKYDDDDGRTIVDMSELSRPTLMGGFVSEGERLRKKSEPRAQAAEKPRRPWESSEMSREDRRAYILGALGSGLLIALVYIAGLGFLIGLLIFIFG